MIPFQRFGFLEGFSLHDLVITLAGIGFVYVLGWLSPGPNMLAVASVSISKGRRAGVATAFGLALGGLVWATLTIMGAATVFELFPSWVLVFRLMGATYLGWLGFKYLRNAWLGQGAVMQITQVDYSNWIAFRTGFIVHMTNPKAMLFFSSVYAAFIPASAPLWVWVVILSFSQTQAFVQHCITVWLFSSRAVLRRIETAQRRVNGVIGTLYCGLGLGVASDALRRL